MKLGAYNGNIEDIDYLDLMMLDIYGAIRSVTIPKSHISPAVLKEGIGFDASNYGFADVSKSDMVAIPDMSTAFTEERPDGLILHTLCDVRTMDGDIFEYYPRNVIKNALAYLRREKIADDAQVLMELEFHVLEDVAYATDYAHSYFRLQSAEGIGPDFYDLPRFNIHRGYHRHYPDDRYFDLRNQMVRALTAVGIPVKYHHHEVGAAQLEIEFDFLSIAEAADKVAIAKWIIRNIAAENQVFVTFMPKPINKTPGNGMHVHQYLSRNGEPTFSGDGMFGLSTEALCYTAGLLEHSLSGSLLGFTNPSTNSFKRLVPGYEAPVCATFAKASREAAVRIPGYLSRGSERIEYRTGDATANPHYMLAAMLLAGIDGIQRKLDPVAAGYADASLAEDRRFPLDLHSVMQGLLRDNDYLRPAFPQELIEMWSSMKLSEATHVYHAPTPEEYELYFNV
ncbi:glutamine synthetase family protein [Spirochaeta africana]|uniref:Glutamine synthetase n=1 Tax=Spirochaeta africana (strain ATCC 700263 / DSM 8902 / Z-7692) TaxID=889378 RepID=H9UID5_SPIAZ|nr:glutamine synthetase beta-grasp domain-containing protein [Spirochaeta africana]AFG37278.1 glutamine synthetase [Spirochaeta africana DSM 8902]